MLFEEFSIGSKEPVIVSIKDHVRTPAAFFFLSSAIETELPEHSQSLDRFLLTHRFPSAFELTSGNFQEVMRGSTADVIVIVPVIKSAVPGAVGTETILTQTHKEWSSRLTKPSAETLPATFVWMDIDRWAEWLEATYGFKWSPEGVPRVILADHKVRTRDRCLRSTH